jgi:hypothetical protein
VRMHGGANITQADLDSAITQVRVAYDQQR